MSGRLYHLEPRDKTGVFLGLGVGELMLVGGGVFCGILMRLGGAPVTVAAAPVLAGVALAKLRVGGTPLREWARLALSWALSRALGRHRFQAPLPLFSAVALPAAQLPAPLAGIDVVEVPVEGRPVAAVRDRRRGRLTVVVPVSGPQFAGLEPGAQDALLAAWGDALGTLAAGASPITQIGWSDTAGPTELVDHRAWAAERARANGAEAAPVGSYEELVGEVAACAQVHETVLWVTVDGRRAGGAGRPAERAAAQLPTAVDDVAAACDRAGVVAQAPLRPAGLWRLLRARIDPFDAAMRREGEGASLAERLGLVGAHNGGPVAVAAEWSHLRLDRCFHRVYWIESWPRRPVPGDWLSGWLSQGECCTTTVAYYPIEPRRSQRRIDSQLTKLAANRARKAESQRRVTEAEHRTEAAVAELEAELASGHAEHQFLGLVAVPAASLEELEARCHRIEQAARAAGLSLRCVCGVPDVAWAATLPFGLLEPGLLDLFGI